MISRAKWYLSGSGLGPVLVKAVTGSALVRIVGMGFGFLVGIQLARGMGPAGYGIYGLVMAFVSIIAVPVEFGVPALLTREVAANSAKSKWGEVRGALDWAQRTVLFSFCALLVTLVLVAWIFSDKIDSGLLLPGLIGIFYIPVAALANLRSAALRGLQQLVKGDMPAGLVRPALYSALLAIVGLFAGGRLSPALAIGLQLLAVSASLLLAAHLLRQALPVGFNSFTPIVSAREWRNAAFPMAMSEGLRVVQGQFPILVLGWVVSISEVGLFRVASSMLIILGTPMTLLNVIAGPVVAKLHAEGDRFRLQRFLTWSSFAMGAMVFGLSFPFFVFGEPIVGMLFGSEFEAASVPLAIMAIGLCFHAMYGVGVVTLNMTGHHTRVTRLLLVSLVLLFVLTPLMSWAWGVDGAAVAAAISMGLFGLLAWREVRIHLAMDTSVFSIFKALQR